MKMKNPLERKNEVWKYKYQAHEIMITLKKPVSSSREGLTVPSLFSPHFPTLPAWTATLRCAFRPLSEEVWDA